MLTFVVSAIVSIVVAVAGAIAAYYNAEQVADRTAKRVTAAYEAEFKTLRLEVDAARAENVLLRETLETVQRSGETREMLIAELQKQNNEQQRQLNTTADRLRTLEGIDAERDKQKQLKHDCLGKLNAAEMHISEIEPVIRLYRSTYGQHASDTVELRPVSILVPPKEMQL